MAMAGAVIQAITSTSFMLDYRNVSRPMPCCTLCMAVFTAWALIRVRAGGMCRYTDVVTLCLCNSRCIYNEFG